MIAVTPIFNASYSGLFKTFFDVLEEGSLDGVPVLVAATGGTARHSLALDFAMRPLFAYLRADVVPTGVFAATEDWGSAGQQGSLARRVERAGHELAAAVAGRARVERADPFADPDRSSGCSQAADTHRFLGRACDRVRSSALPQ